MNIVKNAIHVLLVIAFSVFILLSVFCIKYISYNAETIGDLEKVIAEVIEHGKQP